MIARISLDGRESTGPWTRTSPTVVSAHDVKASTVSKKKMPPGGFMRPNENKISESLRRDSAELELDISVMQKLVFTAAAIRFIDWLGLMNFAGRAALAPLIAWDFVAKAD